jgi:hypothetical protein
MGAIRAERPREGPRARRPVSSSIIHPPRCAAGCAFVLVLGLGACSPSEHALLERSIGAPQRIEGKPDEMRLFASSAERFGLSSSAASATAAFDYSAPSGWSEQPPTELRSPNFKIGERGMECYVTVLAGDGGGALANVNRWCGQLSLAPWGQAQLDAAPRIAMFGEDALLVALGDESSKKMLLGALAKSESRAVFVKLTGDPAEVLAQRAAFESFCTSLAKKP